MATIVSEKAVYERLLEEFKQLEDDLLTADNGCYLVNSPYHEVFNRFTFWFRMNPEIALIVYLSLRRDRDYWKRLGTKWLDDDFVIGVK